MRGTEMPPEREDGSHDDSAASRSYYRDRYRSKDSSSSDSHQSPFWDSYGYGLKDNYGYGYSSKEQGQSYDYVYPSERILGSYSSPCQASLPGYRLAFQDPSFALGLFVVGALATYILYRAISDAGIGKKKRNISGNILPNFWSGKI